MGTARLSSDSADAAAEPVELCGYPIERTLTAGHTYLARGEAGRLVVLKKMDSDCLLDKGLHPSITDRLSRVRELAHTGVANLYGVGQEKGKPERDATTKRPTKLEAWLIWEFVTGQTALEWAATTGAGGRTSRELLVMARELILSVDSLHRQGIVHGALVEGNVIVAPDGSVRLTHVSPLLYTDLHVDVESVIALLRELVHACGKEGADLARVLDEFPSAQADVPGDDTTLRRLGARIAGVLEAGGGTGQDAQTQGNGDAGTGLRRWMLMQALLVAAAAAAAAYGVWRAFAE